MECKFCGAQLEDGVTLCAACGKDNAEAPEQEVSAPVEEQEIVNEEIAENEPVSDEETEAAAAEEAEDTQVSEDVPAEEPKAASGKKWKLVLVVAACGILLAALLFGILYGMGFRLSLAENDIYAKENYCIDEDRSVAHANRVVATLGDYKLTNAELQTFYWNGVYSYMSEYSNYLSYIGLDPSLPLAEQVCYEDESMTWQQYFLNSALQNWATYARLCMLAKEEGYTLDVDVQEYLSTLRQEMETLAAESDYASAEAMLDEAMGKACSLDAYVSYMELCVVGDGFFAELAESFVPEDVDLDAYYAANEAFFVENGVAKDNSKLVDVRHILLQPAESTTDENGNTIYTENAWNVCQKETEGVYNSWLDGDKTEASFADLATRFSQDPGSASNGGLYTQVAQGEMVEAFDAWIMDESRQPGDHGIVKTEFGYHIMYYVGHDLIWELSVQSQIYNEKVGELSDLLVERWEPEFKYKNIVLSKDIFNAG